MISDRERQIVMLMADLRAGGRSLRARITDISKGGAKLKGVAGVPVDALVRIELPAIGWLAASVAWVRGDAVGLRFHAAIDPAAVRQAVTGTYVRPAPPPAPVVRRVA